MYCGGVWRKLSGEVAGRTELHQKWTFLVKMALDVIIKACPVSHVYRSVVLSLLHDLMSCVSTD